MAEVQISEIQVKVGSTNIKLSVDDARKLQSLLNELFGKSVEIKVIEKEVYPIYRPYITWETDNKIQWDTSKIFCDTSVKDSPVLMCCSQ